MEVSPERSGSLEALAAGFADGVAAVLAFVVGGGVTDCFVESDRDSILTRASSLAMSSTLLI